MEGMEALGSAEGSVDSGSGDSSTYNDGGDTDTQAAGGAEANQEGSAQNKAQKSLKQQVRELGDQDLESVVQIKVNGQTKRMSVRDAIKLAQKGEGAETKFNEASQLKRQAESLMQFAKANPKEFFKQLGMDPYEFAETTLAEKLEMMQMSPEQKKLRDYEERVKKFEDQEKRQREEFETQKHQAEEQRAMQSLDQEMTEAFKASQLPKHPFYVQQIAAAMLAAENQGQQLTAKEATDMIKGRFNQHTREIFESLDANAIRDILGDSVLKKLRQAEVDRVSGKAAPTIDSGSRPAQKAVSKPNTQTKQKSVTEKGWRQYLETLKTGA